MCLLLFYVNPDPKSGKYSCILINTRDEFYDRPTAKAKFWKQNPNVIGGMDMEAGKQGGTWLAMNSNGKISSLLNILQPQNEILPDKKGRGFLAVDFMNIGDSASQYAKKVFDQRNDYNGFLLVLIDLRNVSEPSIAYASNVLNCNPQFLEPGIHAFGNSIAPNMPWPKVMKAKEKFTEVIKECSTYEHDELVQELFKLLQDKTRHGLDNNMKKQGEGLSEDYLDRLSAIYVDIPYSNYGSRCHTVILIDHDGHVNHYERSRNGQTNPNSWTTNHTTFKLKNDQSWVS